MTTNSTIADEPARRRWLTRERVVIYSGAFLATQVILLVIWAVAHWGLHVPAVPPLGVDFRVYWSASYVTLYEGALAAFDHNKLLSVEAQLLAGVAMEPPYAPWVYPPSFQLLIYPLALLPYPASYVLFISAGLACCLLACTPMVKPGALPWVSVIAFPGIWIAIMTGQNSLLTLALTMAALTLLERRPLLAGLCAGSLAIKPQLAVLFPLLFICGGHFRALGAMVVMCIFSCALSGLIFGPQLWFRFFEAASWFSSAIVERGEGGMWNGMSTVFAFARQLGANIPVAYAIHAAIALPVVATTAFLWTRNSRCNFELRAAAFGTSTLLVQPYLMYYDLAWLIFPLGYLAIDHARRGTWNNVDRAIVIIVWASPMVVLLAVFGPPVGKLGLMLLSKWGVLGMLLLFIATSRHALVRTRPSVQAVPVVR